MSLLSKLAKGAGGLLGGAIGGPVGAAVGSSIAGRLVGGARPSTPGTMPITLPPTGVGPITRTAPGLPPLVGLPGGSGRVNFRALPGVGSGQLRGGDNRAFASAAGGGGIGGAIATGVGSALGSYLTGRVAGAVAGGGCGCGSNGRDPCTHQKSSAQSAPLATFFGGCCPPGRVLRRIRNGRDVCIRQPRMNVFNPRALARADRRLTGFSRRASVLLKDFGYTVSAHKKPAHLKPARRRRAAAR